MPWTFKDRFKPSRSITINDDFPQLLALLEETFQDFRDYNSLDAVAQTKRVLENGRTFAKVIFIHTQISYCLGTRDCQEDFYYDFYCNTVRKYFIDVHPMFAMKKYAEFIAFIKSETESIEVEMPALLKKNIDKYTDDI